jgi:propanol-preferring alcohol dehydrogenase
VHSGQRVLIVGIGGVGLLALQIAVHFGAKVWAVDIKPTSRQLAKESGAVEAWDLETLDAQLAKGFTVDVGVDFVSSSTCERLSILAFIGICL